MKRNEAVLRDIVEAARQIRTLVRRETRSLFHEGTLVQSAVLHQLFLVLGGRQAAFGRLSDAAPRCSVVRDGTHEGPAHPWLWYY